MLKKKHVIIGFLVFCLTATLLVGVTSSADYDPWCDINDDGLIDIVDIVNLAIRFGEEGTPINKTALLLELQQGIYLLNMSIGELGLRMDDAEADIADLNATLEARIPQKGYISVSAAAFNPYESAWDTRNPGYHIHNYENACMHIVILRTSQTEGR